MIAAVPWVLAFAYLVSAPFIAEQSSEGWGYLILEVITFPAGILFSFLTSAAHSVIFGDPMRNDSLLSSDIYRCVRFAIYVGGGALWFFGIGVVIRRTVRRLLRLGNGNEEPNQALHATSEPAPSAGSSAHEG